MNTLILFVPKHCEWDPWTWTSQNGGVLHHDQVVLHTSDESLYVSHYDDLHTEYEPSEVARVHRLIVEYEAYSVYWRGANIITRLLRAIPDPTSIVVDNDHGLIAYASNVVAIPAECWLFASTLPSGDDREA